MVDGDRQAAAELARVARHVDLLDPVDIDPVGDRIHARQATAVEVGDRHRPPRRES